MKADPLHISDYSGSYSIYQLMTKTLQDLPLDILNSVCSSLCQTDLVNLALSCKSLHFAAREALYSNIYIAEKAVSIREKEHLYAIGNTANSRKLQTLHNWTVVGSCLGKTTNSFKLLERSLAANYKLAEAIKNVLCDDITFVLFKLKSWGRRFFNESLKINLRLIYFGSVPLNHLNIAYDDILGFYRMSNKTLLNLTTLQLRDLLDLSLLVADVSDVQRMRVTSLSLNMTDMSGVELLGFDRTDSVKLKTILKNVTTLSIVSVHNLSLRFISALQAWLGAEKVFPNVVSLAINHIHGQTSNTDRFNFNSRYDISKETKLDFGFIASSFNIHLLRSLDLRIGCNHVQSPLLAESSFYDVFGEDSGDGDHCACLSKFIYDMSACVSKGSSLRKLSVAKLGESVVTNPYGVFLFKQLMISFLETLIKELLQLHFLRFDTSCTVFPFYNFDSENSQFVNMVGSLRHQNEILLETLNQLDLPRLELPDFVESYYLWDMADAFLRNGNSIALACDCLHCKLTQLKWQEFVHVNQKIQFYLNPTVNKSYHQYYFDILQSILSILREPKVVSLSLPSEKSDETEQRAKASVSEQAQSFVLNNGQEVMQVVHGDIDLVDLSLHQLFRHGTYKDLVNYHFVKNLMRGEKIREYEIECGCRGNELKVFVTMLVHQLGVERFGGSVTLNGIDVCVRDVGGQKIHEVVSNNCYDYRPAEGQRREKEIFTMMTDVNGESMGEEHQTR